MNRIACGTILAAVLGWALPFTLGGSARAEAALLINEVLADPPAAIGDANGDGVVDVREDEFVELVNTASDPVPLVGWTVWDGVGIRHTFGDTASISGYGFFVIFGGGLPMGFSGFVDVASSGALGLNNNGDTIALFGSTGTLVDTFSYGIEGGRDASLTRWPDATGPFVLHTSAGSLPFSPGTTVDGRTSLTPSHGEELIIPEPLSLLTFGPGFLTLILLMRRRPRRLRKKTLLRSGLGALGLGVDTRSTVGTMGTYPEPRTLSPELTGVFQHGAVSAMTVSKRDCHFLL